MQSSKTTTWLLLIALSLLTGCSSFHREWRAATAQPIPADNIAGPWQGVWSSDVNGHTGKLRCIITETSDSRYKARYHAKYRKVLSFGYTADLHAERSGDVFRFDGSADLGALAGGVYHYNGEATPAKFFSTYTSKHDRGTFEMKRP